MKTKTIVVLPLLVFHFLSLNSQSLFSTLYGGAEEDLGFGIAQQSDNFLLLGYTESFSALNGDIYLLQVDSLGNEISSQLLGDTLLDRGFSINRIADQNFLICGSSSTSFNGASKMLMIKINSAGTPIWQKTYQESDEINFLSDVEEVSDKSLLAVGATGNALAEDILILKTDSLGNQERANIIDLGYQEFFQQIVKTSTDDFFAIGEVREFGNWDILFSKIDAEGDTVWVKRIDDPAYFDQGKSIDIINEDEFILLGQSLMDDLFGFKLIKFSSEGEIIWQKLHLQDEAFDANYVTHLADGGFLVGGDIGRRSASRSTIIKMDDQGEIVWEQEFPGASKSEIKQILEVEDGFLLVGNANRTNLGDQDLNLIKVDKEGQLTSIFGENVEPLSWKFAPNPADNFIQIHYPENFSGQLQICDIQGKIVLAKEINTQLEENIDLTSLEAGTYFVTISNLENRRSTKKLTILK